MLSVRFAFALDCRRSFGGAGVQRMLQLARERANLDIKATPHTLRHCFASNCARQSSLHNVKELLGHQSIRSTEIYLHTRPEDLRAAVTF